MPDEERPFESTSNLTNQELDKLQSILNKVFSESKDIRRLGFSEITNASEEFRQHTLKILLQADRGIIFHAAADLELAEEKYIIEAYKKYAPDEIINLYVDSFSNTEFSQKYKQQLGYLFEGNTVQNAIREMPFYYATEFGKDPNYKPVDWASYSDQELAAIIKRTDPSYVMANWGVIQSRNNIESIVKDLVKADPSLIVKHIEKFDGKPYQADLITSTVEANNSLLLFLHKSISSFPELKETLLTEDKLIKAALDEPFGFLENMDDYKNESFVGPALKQLAEKNPNVILEYQSPKHILPRDILDIAIKGSPVWAYNYTFREEKFLPSDIPFVMEKAKSSMQPYLDRMSGVEDWVEIGLVRDLNQRHEQTDIKRYDVISQLGTSGYYQLLTQGRKEIYTSTYNHLYDGFVQKLAQDKKSFTDFLDENPERKSGLPSLIEGLSTYARFDDFLSRLDNQQKEVLTNAVMDQLKADPLNTVSAANYIKNLKPGDPALALVENRIIEGYATSSGNEHDAVGTLGRWYIEKSGHTPHAENLAAFQSLQNIDRYQMPSFDKVESSQLFDSSRRHFQMHVFYNDEDGFMNYDLFRKNMNLEGWSAKENQQAGFSHYQKTSEGRTVHLYATIPQHGTKDENNDQAVKNIQNEIASQNGKITFVAHRGHSYHIEDTISHLTPDAQIVFLGGCGGSDFIQKTLDNAPRAAIIATSGIGTRFVNEPLMDAINDRIIAGQAVVWKPMEAIVDKIKDKRAEDYILPSQNTTAVFYSTLRNMGIGEIAEGNNTEIAIEHDNSADTNVSTNINNTHISAGNTGGLNTTTNTTTAFSNAATGQVRLNDSPNMPGPVPAVAPAVSAPTAG